MTVNEIGSCEEALRLLAAHLDRELDDGTDAAVERHLSKCRSCCSRAEFEARLRDIVSATGRAPVRRELTSRVETLIRQFTVSGGE